MAGNFPDVPGPRMAYDRDGSIVFENNSGNGVTTEWTTDRKRSINGEDPNAGSQQAADGYFGIIFPELRDIAGMYLHAGDSAENAPSHGWSANTTNGMDGTWTDFSLTRYTGGSNTKEMMRKNIDRFTLSGVKGIRHWRTNLSTYGSRKVIRSYHIYGQPASGQAPNRLRFWEPSANAELGGAAYDWGDVPRNTEVDRTMRVHNPSTTLTATSVSLSTEALTDATPSVPPQHLFSVGGGAFATTLNLGDLAPGATSAVVTVRRATPSDASLGLWTARMVASASSWV